MSTASHPSSWGIGGFLLALAVLGVTPLAAAQVFEGPASRSFEVRSEPSGATVETISGSHGRTPLSLNERDIYPNTYAADKVGLYGVVILTRNGCEPRTIRPTEGDIQQGIRTDLACGPTGASTGAASGQAAPGPPQSTGPGTMAEPSPGAESLPERRLRQLRVIQELLDEGLISREEEARIRRRILERQ